jgi:hypothetical protein
MKFLKWHTLINDKGMIIILHTIFGHTCLRYLLRQGLPNCGTSSTVQWYKGLIRKNQRIKKLKLNPDTHTPQAQMMS